MSIFYYKGEDGSFHSLPALVGPPGKDGAIAYIENENGDKYSLPILKFINCEITADEEKITISPSGAQGSGHIIQNNENNNMSQREILKFAEGFQVSDDSETGKTVISYAGTKNVSGYVGEISLFADNQLRENHVWADGSTINPATWPDLAAYAATVGWEIDSGTGWYKTPDLRGRFLLPRGGDLSIGDIGGEEKHTLTAEELPGHTHGLSVGYRTLYMSADEGQNRKSGDLITESGTGTKQYTTASAGGGQAHNNMPPYYVVTAQIRAKVDEITAKIEEVNSNTKGGFLDSQLLVQQDGKIIGRSMYTKSDFGQLGGAVAGTFEFYGKVTGMKYPDGSWRVDFAGKIENNGQPSGAYGLDLAKIAALLGTTLSQVDRADTSWFGYTADGAPLPMSWLGYGGNLTLSQGFLMPGRYYQTNGASGTWGASTGVAMVGNYWTGYFYAK